MRSGASSLRWTCAKKRGEEIKVKVKLKGEGLEFEVGGLMAGGCEEFG